MDKVQIFKNRLEAPQDARVVDIFNSSLTEFFFISNPQLEKGSEEAQLLLQKFLSENQEEGVWIWYPWINTLVHTLSEELYFAVRTARNRNIIKTEEQAPYRELKIGIAGLSVGSQILSSLVMSGGPKRIKIADFDTIEVSNLNRIASTLPEVGVNKAVVAARKIYELDPFAEIDVWSSGIARETLEEFLLNDLKLDIFIDEMDSIDLKVISRIICRKNRIPVLMATDNGDGIILDVERFDLDSELPLFHGAISDIEEKIESINPDDWLKLATQIIQPEYLTQSMQESLLEMGKSIAGVPQLGTSAAMAGSAVSYAVRKIATKQDLKSGRYTLNLEEALNSEYNSTESKEARAQATKDFLTKFQSK